MKYLNEINQVLAGRNIHECEEWKTTCGEGGRHYGNLFCSMVYELTNNPRLSYYLHTTYNDSVNAITQHRKNILNEIEVEVKELIATTINPKTGLTGDEQKVADKIAEEIKYAEKKIADDKARVLKEAYKVSEANKPCGRYAYYKNLTEMQKKFARLPARSRFDRQAIDKENVIVLNPSFKGPVLNNDRFYK